MPLQEVVDVEFILVWGLCWYYCVHYINNYMKSQWTISPFVHMYTHDIYNIDTWIVEDISLAKPEVRGASCAMTSLPVLHTDCRKDTQIRGIIESVNSISRESESHAPDGQNVFFLSFFFFFFRWCAMFSQWFSHITAAFYNRFFTTSKTHEVVQTLPCFLAFGWSAIPTAHYSLVFFSLACKSYQTELLKASQTEDKPNLRVRNKVLASDLFMADCVSMP